MELLLTKYMKAYISYDGLYRIEEYLFPEAALREALLNAICHKDYSSNAPIQIRVYEDKIIIFNEAQLPDNWTIENLKQIHSSKPFNPYIASTFFRTGLIEAWGRGTLKIIDECFKYGNPAPLFKYYYSDFMLEIRANKILNKSDKNEKVSEKMSEKIIRYISENAHITIAELSSNIGVTGRTIERNINKLQKENRLKRSGGDRAGKWEILKG